MGGIRPALPLKGDCMLDFMTYLPPVTDAPLPEPGSAGAFFLEILRNKTVAQHCVCSNSAEICEKCNK